MLSGKFGLMLLLIVMIRKCLLRLSSYAFLTWFFLQNLGHWDLRMICQAPFPTWGWDPICAYKGRNYFLVFYYASIWLFNFIEFCVW